MKPSAQLSIPASSLISGFPLHHSSETGIRLLAETLQDRGKEHGEGMLLRGPRGDQGIGPIAVTSLAETFQQGVQSKRMSQKRLSHFFLLSYQWLIEVTARNESRSSQSSPVTITSELMIYKQAHGTGEENRKNKIKHLSHHGRTKCNFQPIFFSPLV